MISKKEIEQHFIPPKILPWIIACAFFMQMLDGTILNTALPAIALSIKENPLEIESIIIAYFLTVAFLLPLSGWMADRFGSKKIFIISIILFTLGSLLCSLSNTLTELVLSRIFQATGGALMVPVGRLIVLKTYPKNELIKMLSFIMLPALVGPLIGPVLGGFLVEYLSWHWIFLINIPVGIICILIAIKSMPNITENNRYKFDKIGFALFSTAIILICLAFNNSKLFNISLLHKLIISAASLFMLIAYYLYAKKHKKPLFSLDLLKTRSFVVGGLGSLFSRIGIGALPYLTPLLLQVGLGYSPAESGMMILTLGISGIIAKSFVEKILKTFGFRRFLFINTLIMGITMCGFALITSQTSVYTIIIFLYIYGTLNSLQFTSMVTLSLIDLPQKYSSEGNSLVSTIMQISMTIGISLGAGILSYFSNDISDNHELLCAFRNTYIILGIFTALSSLNFILTPKDAGIISKNSL